MCPVFLTQFKQYHCFFVLPNSQSPLYGTRAPAENHSVQLLHRSQPKRAEKILRGSPACLVFSIQNMWEQSNSGWERLRPSKQRLNSITFSAQLETPVNSLAHLHILKNRFNLISKAGSGLSDGLNWSCFRGHFAFWMSECLWNIYIIVIHDYTKAALMITPAFRV